MCILYPIAEEKWILRQDNLGQELSRRKSPKRGSLCDLGAELVYITPWLGHPNLSVEAVFIREESVWRDDGNGSWRRKGWSQADRRLLEVLHTQRLHGAADYCAFTPPGAGAVHQPRAASAWGQTQEGGGAQDHYTLQRPGLPGAGEPAAGAGCIDRYAASY